LAQLIGDDEENDTNDTLDDSDCDVQNVVDSCIVWLVVNAKADWVHSHNKIGNQVHEKYNKHDTDLNI